ncbi:MANSC domain-containing protein 4 isoform X2 [Athene cunicularia]|uniref:MANSC domain-containing protein 4 isoform X2 n=1 Tax=Athene cunicularia TaxID=194338 RepID=UPI000EF75672|nr:MANSC domain-containing protein 4 isoform X2 [Athene cunicularia]
MKCWSDTGHRLLTNCKSLLIPPRRAHGTVGHWLAAAQTVSWELFGKNIPWLLSPAELALCSPLKRLSLKMLVQTLVHPWRRTCADGARYFEEMVLLVAIAEALLVLGLAVETDSLCSPTTFYKNCWIRRFPGLLIDLRESQKRGAQLLKISAEASPQQCSRTCCLLRNVSCNLAVFYHGAIHENMNCLHVSCPALESCILKARINVILYNITTGIDPDLLIFEKLTSKEPNTQSLSKYERQNSTKTTEWERCQHHNATSSSLLRQAPSSTTSHGLTANTYISTTSQKTEVTTYSRAETFLPDDHFAKSTSTTSASTTSITSSNKKSVPSTLISESAKVFSRMPTPPRLNSSKQHLNETKGYSGRNYTSDNEASAWEAANLGVWLIPVVLCSSLIFLCCCTVAFTAGRCSNRRGQYKPIRRGRTTSRQFIKYTTVKGNL